MVDYSDVLKRLKAYRENLNMTKDEMAKMFDVHPTHYGKLESGSIRISYEGLNPLPVMAAISTVCLQAVSGNRDRLKTIFLHVGQRPDGKSC